MPRLNSRGEWCAGIGGASVSVGTESGKGREVIPYQSGSANWVDDDTVIGQFCNGESCRVVTAPGLNEVLNHGANFIEANGGTWAAWFGSLDPATVGITTATGLRFPSSGLGPIGPDGAIAIKNDYQSAGPWDVYEQDGSRWRLTDGDAFAINLLGEGRAFWVQPRLGAQTRGIPVPQIFSSPAWWFRVLPVQDQWWILYQRKDGMLVLHPFDSPFGYLIAQENTYRPDVRVLANGLVRVVWAVSEEESIASIRVRDLDLATSRSDVRLEVPPPPPPPPPPVMELIAPNIIDTVRRVIQEHPEINTKDEDKRGRIIDYVCDASNPAGRDRPWGRKSRNREGTDLNTDGLTYLRPDGLFEIYDVIGGTSGKATWEGFGPFKQGENGFWVPAQSGSPVPVPVPVPTPKPTGPSLDTWIHGEFPKLVAEFKRKRPELGEPGHEWAAFQTYRRYVEGWTFDHVFAEV